MIKLIASDVDGTLVGLEKNKLDSRLFDVIRELDKREIKFVVASGRQYSNIRRLFAPVADIISFISDNGAMIMKNDETLFCDEISKEAGRLLMSEIINIPTAEPMLSSPDVTYIRTGNEYLYNRLAVELGNKTSAEDDILSVEDKYIKISMFMKSGITEEIQSYFEDLCDNGPLKELECALGGPNWLDFSSKNVHKGTALNILQNMFNIKAEETMAFGDNQNDLGLMFSAEESFCMATGNPKAKEKAKHITNDVTQTLINYFDINI